MRTTSTIAITAILGLALLLAFPSPYLLPARAVQQCCPNVNYSPFGPRPSQVVFKVYVDTPTMMADFDAGLIDLTDVPDPFGPNRLDCSATPASTPIGSSPLGCDQNNANYYVTNQQAELGEEQLDASHQVTFLGVSFWCNRYSLPAAGAAGDATCSPSWKPQTPAISINSDTAAACDATHFDLTIHLKNYEQNLALVSDSNEIITATPAAGSASQKTGITTGTYDLGCLSGLSPGYAVTTALFGDAATPVSNPAKVSISTPAGGTGPLCANNKLCDVDFKVDYNSPTTKNPTTASVNIMLALQHLLDKPNFLTATGAGGAVPPAVCIDIWSSPAQAIMPAGARGACDASGQAEALASTISAESTLLNSAGPAGWSLVPGCSAHVSVYNCVSDVIGGSPVASCPIPVYTGGGACFPTRQNTGSDNDVSTRGYSGAADLTAACDYFVLAGFTVNGGHTCADVINGVAGAHLSNNGQQIAYYIRHPGAFPARPLYGGLIADELEYLFGNDGAANNPTGAVANGGTVCYGGLSPTPGPGATCSKPGNAVQYYSIGQVSGIVFTATGTWNLYTGAQSTGSTPDAVLYSWHSQFAGATATGNTCGGPLTEEPGDYDMYCDPILDTQANAGEFSASYLASFAFFINTADISNARPVLVPVLAQNNRFVGLNAYNTESSFNPTSLVPSNGHGFEASGPGAYWTMLNAHPNGITGYGNYKAVTDSKGNPIIRRASTGASQGVLKQNVFTSNTVWEVDIIDEIWDSMLVSNPNTAGSSLQLIDYMTTSHSSVFDPSTGLNTQTFTLRGDVCWQDSTINPGSGVPCDRPVTADDVCFTVAVEEFGPALNRIGTQDVVSCTQGANPRIVKVVHQGLSPFQLINIGGQAIVPAHIWGSACGWTTGPHFFTNQTPGSVGGVPTTVVGAACTKITFDGMVNTPPGAPSNVDGFMIGSGPFICQDVSNPSKIGGHCALEADGTTPAPSQSLDVSWTERLVRNNLYMRCCDPTQGSPLQAESWADTNKDGKVTIIDAASIASVFGKNDKYLDHPVYGTVAGTVDIVDSSFLDAQYDSGSIAPCVNFACPGTENGQELTPAAALVTQTPSPNLDPYLVDLGGGVKMYYMGLTATGGTGTLEIASVGNTSPSAGSFTASLDGGAPVTGVADATHATATTIINPGSPAGGNVKFTFSGVSSAAGHTIVISSGSNVIFIANT